jgi:predicted transposase/invertase (TIGR01784 family)
VIELLDLKVDVVFKDFFGDRSSKEILESFLNTVLEFEGDDRIEVEEFIDPRKMRVEVGKPSTFVDLSVKTKGGERYIVEMQTYNHEGFDKRLLYYLGKDYTEQIEYQYHTPQNKEKLKKRIGWGELPRVHIVAITDFHRDQKGKNGILNSHGVVETYRFNPEVSASNNHIFDHWKASIIDLKKFKAQPFNHLKTDKEKWIYILSDAPSLKEEDREALKKDPIFQRAIEKLEMLSSDPKRRKAYEASVNDQRDHVATIDAAKQEGHREGRKEEKHAIALKMLKRNRPVDEIAEDTGLSIEEIHSLA